MKEKECQSFDCHLFVSKYYNISSWIHIYDIVCKKHGKLNNNTGRIVKSGETLLNVLNIKNINKDRLHNIIYIN